MILVDTSVWVDHLRVGDAKLADALRAAQVATHPFVIGELACGNIKNRAEILSLLRLLPMAVQAEHEEVLRFIETNHLMGQGLGYVDVHLAVSAALTGVPIWTLDKSLDKISKKLNISYLKS